jgi:hypothetical protein
MLAAGSYRDPISKPCASILARAGHLTLIMLGRHGAPAGTNDRASPAGRTGFHGTNIRSQSSVSRVRRTIRRVNRILKPRSDVPTFTESRH